MSIDMNFAPLAEMTLFSSSFIVSMLAVGVPQSPGQLMKSPPTVSLTLLGSPRPYVTSFHLAAGKSSFVIKNIVFVPLTRPSVPCANLPNSLPYVCPHISLYFGFPIRCQYSMSSPVSSLSTAFSMCRGNFLTPVS